MAGPFDDVAYRDDLETVAFAGPTPEAATAKAEAWMKERMTKGSFHIAGSGGVKTGKYIYVAVIVFSAG